MRTPTKRTTRRRWALIGALLVLALLIAVALLPRTEWARTVVRDLLTQSANDALEGTLTVERLEGNLWGSVRLQNVTLTGRRDTLARLATLHLDYDLLPLLRGEIRLRQLTLDSLHLRLRQSEQGVWNAADIIPPGDSTAGEASPFPWKVTVSSLSIRGLSAVIQPAGDTPSIPRVIERFDLQGSLAYAAEHWEAAITACSLTTAHPTLHLRRMVIAAKGDAERASIDTLSLATDRISLGATATARTHPERAFSVSLQTSTPSFDELRLLLPGFPLQMLPALRLTADYARDTLTIHGDLGAGAVRLKGSIAAVSRNPVASAWLDFTDINPGQWLAGAVPPLGLTGRLSVQAPLDNPIKGTTVFSLALEPSTVNGRAIHQASLNGSIDEGTIRTTVTLAAPGLSLDGRLGIRDLTGSQDVSASITFTDVDPSLLADLEQLPGSLNGSLDIRGGPLDIERFQGGIILNVQRSQLASLPLDSLLLRCSLDSPEAAIDTLVLCSPVLTLEGSGRAWLDGAVDLEFHSRLQDATPLAALAGLDTILGRGDIRGRFFAARDSLAGSAQWQLSGLRGFGASADHLTGSGTLVASHAGPAINAQLVARGISAGPVRADSVSATGNYRHGVSAVQSSIILRDDARIDLAALVMRDSLLHLAVPRLRVTLGNDEWTTGPDTMRYAVGNGALTFSHAALFSGSRSIAASGRLSKDGANDFTFTIDRLPLTYLRMFLESPPPLTGELSATAHLEGMLPEPLASCSLAVTETALGAQHQGSIRALAQYGGDSTLTWQLVITGEHGNQLAADGMLPLSHSATWDSVVVPRDRPLQVRLLIDDFRLNRLAPAFPMLDRLEGLVNSDLSLGGTLQSPAFGGSLRIDSGAVSSRSLGIAYDSVGLGLAGEDTLLLLRDFTVRSSRGVLQASGILASVNDVLGQALRPRQLTLTLRDFQAIASEDLELRLTGPLRLQSDRDTLRIDGDLTVPRARVWLPAFVGHRTPSGMRGTPRLVAALQEGDSAAVRDTLAVVSSLSPALERIAGRIRVRIPGNMWLQNQELNVEISGDLELALSGPSIAITGFAKVERGTFVMLGKKFVVREGRADFSGGTELVPQIWMEVAYEFRRSDGMEQSLDLIITGKATNPSLSFRLNGEPVSEQDAVSYVLFGRSLDELSQSQRSSVSQSTGDLAAGLAASFLTAQLSSTVGEAFGLDVLELDVQDAGRQSSFTAGKYLSDRLYVRYTRRINDPSTNETNTDEVAIEFRLLPFLYIQMIQGTSKATGYDLLFRFD